MKKNKSNSNAVTPDKSMDKGFLDIANIESGTDVSILDGDLRRELEINSGVSMDGGVTRDAPYQDIAEYKMVSYLEDDENENKNDLVNSQGS